MAKNAGNAAQLLAWHYDLSSVLNNINFDITQELPDVTTFADAGPRVVTGNYGYKQDVSGFFTTDVAYDVYSFWRATGVFTGTSVANYWSYLPAGPTEGGISYDYMMSNMTYSIGAQVGNAVVANFSSTGRAGLGRAAILRYALITGNNVGTGYNTGATVSGQEYRTIIRSMNGTYTTFAVRIEDSNDNGVGDPYVSIAALEQTGITTDTAFVLSTTGATKAWKRVRVLTWTGTDVNLVVTGGLVAGTA